MLLNQCPVSVPGKAGAILRRLEGTVSTADICAFQRLRIFCSGRRQARLRHGGLWPEAAAFWIGCRMNTPSTPPQGNNHQFHHALRRDIDGSLRPGANGPGHPCNLVALRQRHLINGNNVMATQERFGYQMPEPITRKPSPFQLLLSVHGRKMDCAGHYPIRQVLAGQLRNVRLEAYLEDPRFCTHRRVPATTGGPL